MYEIFIYDHKSSHCFYDNEIDANKYPYIELGSRVFIPDLEITYLVLGPGKWVPLGDSKEPAAATTSTLGEAILGNMILGA